MEQQSLVAAELILKRLNLFDILEEEILGIKQIRSGISQKSHQLTKNKNINEENICSQVKLTQNEKSNLKCEENLALFESSNAIEEENLEELVFPGTSKVSEKLSEVLASIRRARERTAYEATQHHNVKKAKNVNKNKKEKPITKEDILEKSPKKTITKVKDDNKVGSNEEFDTNCLDISISPVKNTKKLENKKRNKLKASAIKCSKENSISSSSEEEKEFELKKNKPLQFVSKSVSKKEKSKSASNSLTRSSNKVKNILSANEELEDENYLKTISIDTEEKHETSTSKYNVNKNKLLISAKVCNNADFSKPSAKRSLNCSNKSILESTFEDVCAFGATKKDIRGKMDIFLKSKFEFQSTKKRFKHDIQVENVVKTQKALEIVNEASVEGQCISNISPERSSISRLDMSNNANSSSVSNRTSSISPEVKKYFLTHDESPIRVSVSSKTREKLLKFSAKKNSNPQNKTVIPVNPKKHNEKFITPDKITLNDDSFDITTYCDLVISRTCVDENDSLTSGDKTELNQAVDVASTVKEDSQSNSVPLSNFSQTFSLVDEENLDDIDFDL